MERTSLFAASRFITIRSDICSNCSLDAPLTARRAPSSNRFNRWSISAERPSAISLPICPPILPRAVRRSRTDNISNPPFRARVDKILTMAPIFSPRGASDAMTRLISLTPCMVNRVPETMSVPNPVHNKKRPVRVPKATVAPCRRALKAAAPPIMLDAIPRTSMATPVSSISACWRRS